MSPTAQPLIVTLVMAAPQQARLDALRDAFFPPRSFALPAHLTLLHAVPGACDDALVDETSTACSAQAPFPLALKTIIFLGRGFAVGADAPPLMTLRRRLQKRLWPHLGAQDRAVFRPHVTLANKLTPAAARARMAEAQAVWLPCQTQALGLSIWRYEGGPWGGERRILFAAGVEPMPERMCR